MAGELRDEGISTESGSEEETVKPAHELARRLGEEVGLTIFCYENAATRPERRNLAVVREGEYEALPERLASEEWRPDFGPVEFQPRTGATAVGARDFLVAYNVNLNTTSTRRANAIAFDVREKGRIKREPDPLTGEVVRDAKGEPVWTPGLLKACKGIGWFIEEYGVAQISMNLTDLSVTPVHAAFDACAERALARGVFRGCVPRTPLHSRPPNGGSSPARTRETGWRPLPS